jgi:hypothetical protein
MTAAKIGRIILAVLAGYIADALLVVITNLVTRAPGRDVAQPLRYFVIDLITQCLYTILGGYLAARIAGAAHRAAMLSLICLGLIVGSISLVTSWRMQPHWYVIALLASYPVCVWIGWKLSVRRNLSSAAKS